MHECPQNNYCTTKTLSNINNDCHSGVIACNHLLGGTIGFFAAGGGAKGCLVDGLVGAAVSGLGAGGGAALLPR